MARLGEKHVQTRLVNKLVRSHHVHLPFPEKPDMAVHATPMRSEVCSWDPK